MSPTRECFPITSNFLASALKMQTEYAGLLDEWEVWLQSGSRPSNAQQLQLWQVINITYERRKPGNPPNTPPGIWATVDDKVLPTVTEMDKVIDWKKFNAFRDQMVPRRQQIEDVAVELVNVLESPDFLRQLNAYPDELRLKYIAELSDRLAESNVGMLYMRKACVAPLSPDPALLPALHPKQLTRVDARWRTVDEAGPVARRVARLYVTVLEKLLPALVRSQDPAAFDEVLVDFVTRSVDDARFRAATTIQAKVAIIDEVIFTDKTAWIDQNRPKLWWLQPGVLQFAYSLQEMFDVLNVVLAARKLGKDPKNPAKYAALARAMSSLVGSTITLGKGFRWKWVQKAGELKNGLQRFNAIYDALLGVIALYDTEQAARTGDYSVAAGQAMQAVGLFATAYVAFQTVGVAALVPGMQLLAVAGFVLILAGALIATYTEDSPYEKWLQNSWFGTTWNRVDVDANPGTPMWRSKLKDPATGAEYPDIARQVSGWVSIFYPIAFKVTGDASYVYVTCKPLYAAPDAVVKLYRIENESIPVFTDFHEYPVYSKQLDDTSDPDVVAKVEGTPPNQQVTEWTARLSSRSWWPTLDPSRHWFEVEMTPSGNLTAALQDQVGNSDELPFMIRASTKVEF